MLSCPTMPLSWLQLNNKMVIMNKISRICVVVLLAVLLLPVESSAQSRRDKEQTYVLEQPYEVAKITPPQGKKIKNVILMIGDGMSLMHVYSAWTANEVNCFWITARR